MKVACDQTLSLGHSVHKWSPTFLAPGTSFVEDNSSKGWRVGRAGMVWSLFKLITFIVYFISKVLDYWLPPLFSPSVYSPVWDLAGIWGEGNTAHWVTFWNLLGASLFETGKHGTVEGEGGGRGRVGEQNQFGRLKSTELAEGAFDGTKEKVGQTLKGECQLG